MLSCSYHENVSVKKLPQNSYMEGPGSATINNAAFPRKPGEEVTPSNRNNRITSNQ